MNETFIIQFRIIKTSGKYIIIGVVDKDKQYNQRKSYDSGNAVSYDGRWR